MAFFFEAKPLSLVETPIPLSAQMPCQGFKSQRTKGITAAIGASLEAVFFVNYFAIDNLLRGYLPKVGQNWVSG